jgi:DEAD/DEAH box helicase domain-containing protein
MAIDHVVLDIEIQKTIEETPGGWESTHLLGVAVAVVYEFKSDRFRIYGPRDIKPLRDRLNMAERITTYNGWKFDLPVIWALPQPQRVDHLDHVSDDLLRRIWWAMGLNPDEFTDRHKGCGLDAVCQATIGARKIGNGEEAPLWFQSGFWAMVTEYCVHDVKITRDLCRFIDRFGYVIHPRVGKLVLPPTIWSTR